jgi:hypothetical protein
MWSAAPGQSVGCIRTASLPDDKWHTDEFPGFVMTEVHIVFLLRWFCYRDAGTVLPGYTASQHVTPKCKSSLVQFIHCERLYHLQHRFLRCDVVYTGRWVPHGWTNLLSKTWKWKNGDGGRRLVPIYQTTRCHITGSHVVFMHTAVITLQCRNETFK